MAEKLDTQSEEANSDEGEKISKPSSTQYCGPCLGDNEQNLAEGYCEDCSDYLCLACYTAHRKLKVSRDHRLKAISDMPLIKPNFTDRFKNCAEHKYETVEYYCHSHSCALCKLCKSIDHRTCSSIEALNVVCNNPKKVEEVKKMRDELERVQAAFEENLNSARDNRADIEAYHQKAVNGIRVIRDRDLQMMSAIESACLAVSPQMTSLKNDFDALMDDNYLSFLMMLANEPKVNTLSKRLDSMKMDNTFSKYRFVPSFDKSENLGVIKECCPSKLTSIAVKTPHDLKRCGIAGIAMFSDTRLVVADFYNRKIKLVDLTKSFSPIVSEVKLDLNPWDLTKFDDRRVAVTTYEHKKILIISISEQITITQTIDKSDFSHCCGIECSNGELVVSFLGPLQIQILDPDGTVKQNIVPKNEDGTDFNCTTTCYIKKGFLQETLYLSDFQRNQLVSMTLAGNIQASFTHKYFDGPRGIAVGTDGRVFVCCKRSNKVFELSSDLSKGHIIFDEKDGVSKPISILYDDIDQKLYVGSDGCDMLHVFLV